jgi:hypothetical protein
MALKRILDSLDGVDEAHVALYSETNGRFVLDVEDDPDTGKLNEFRDSNRTLFEENKRLKEQSDNAAAEVKAAKDAVAAGLASGTEKEKTLQQRIADLETANAQEQETATKATLEARRTGLSDRITKAGIELGVKKTALGDFAKVVIDTYQFDDDGGAFVPDGNGGRRMSPDKPGRDMTPEEHLSGYVQDAPHWLEASKGDGAGGDGVTGGGGKRTIPKAETANLTADDWEAIRKGELVVDMGA